MSERHARVWHSVTAAVAVVALVAQLVLTASGHADGADEVSLPVRLGRLVSYFTIQSNLLVAVSSVLLALDPRREDQGTRVLRVAAVVGITVTGIVHFFLLRGLVDLTGVEWVVDKLLHMVVPALALLGFLLCGPRPRLQPADLAVAVAWPVVWLVWTLLVGGATGWYPYPFLDHREDAGTTGVVLTRPAITVFVLVLFALAYLVDRRAAPAPRQPDPYRDGPWAGRPAA